MRHAGMIPNIKQRKDGASRGKPIRKKVAGLSNPDEYGLMALIEGIFGAEETRGHQLCYRLILADHRRRFTKVGAISRNIRAPNRFEHANRLRIPIPSYGAQASRVRLSLARTGLCWWKSGRVHLTETDGSFASTPLPPTFDRWASHILRQPIFSLA